MLDIATHEETLLNSANNAAADLRRKALKSAIDLESLAGGIPDPAADVAKKLLLKAVEAAEALVTEASEAAKGLLAQAAELAATHKKSLMMKTVSDNDEARLLFVKAAEAVEIQKISLLVKAQTAAEALQDAAVEDAISLANLADGIPHPTQLRARELLDEAIEHAKSLLNEASEDAGSLLVLAAERAKTLLTRDKQIEEELIKLRKLASVGVLAGGIAHDFNNILAGVFGNLELAQRELPPEHAAYQYILTANQSIDTAVNLTGQLLTFAKGGEPIFEIIDITPIINYSIKLSLSESSVKRILTLQQDLWLISADKGQLSQVIINLLMNADQAMPEGGTLTIETLNIDGLTDEIRPHLSGKYICLNIGDDGVGISEEQQKNIFDPYFTTKQSGSGLGLATAHSLIAKHGGHISVKSKLGKGTTFSLYLPAKPNAQIPDNVILDDTLFPTADPVNILLMDDNQVVLDVTVNMLESLGCSVETAIDGKQAIEKYIEADKCGRSFDVVIMDLTIAEGMDGEHAIKELLGINPQIKAIVSSGYSDGEVLSNYTEYGFKGKLIKPFRRKTLKTELIKILN